MKVSRIMWYAGTVFTTLAMLAASTTVAAQQQARTPHVRTHPDSTRAERQRTTNIKSFRGVAVKLNTTPIALQNAFENARAANPKLSRGNFIAANVLADNLGARHPNITTGAILSGLQNGRNMGQTLQSLGLSGAEAKQARRAADRDKKEADKRIKDADKCARQEKEANSRERR
jgi:hypothetical protein